MRVHRPSFVALATTALLVAAVVVAPGLAAQVPPLVPSTTTTTTTTTTPSRDHEPSSPSGADLAGRSSQAPAGAEDPGGDGAPAPAGGIRVPPEAQRIISSVRRSAPNGSAPLVDALAALRDLGLSEAEALRVGMGRFPIAGPARYSHDWLFPRYGPGFRFHLGTDVFAAHGTPVRAPVDGIARSANGGLGGLTVKIFMPDGTYFYLAHLSALVDGFAQDMPVRTGDIVGYVGDSGNARGGAPHLHIGIYPRGGPPVDPKPILDQFLAEARARVPALVEAYRAARRPASVPPVSIAEERRVLRPMLATELLHPLASRSGAWPVALLYLTGPTGSRVLLDQALEDVVASIDWAGRG